MDSPKPRQPTPEQREPLLKRIDEIEDVIDGMKPPLSFADQLYVLREHLMMVRRRLEAAPRPPLTAVSS